MENCPATLRNAGKGKFGMKKFNETAPNKKKIIKCIMFSYVFKVKATLINVKEAKSIFLTPLKKQNKRVFK